MHPKSGWILSKQPLQVLKVFHHDAANCDADMGMCTNCTHSKLVRVFCVKNMEEVCCEAVLIELCLKRKGSFLGKADMSYVIRHLLVDRRS